MSNTEIWNSNDQLISIDEINYEGKNTKDIAVCIVNRDRPDLTDSLVENIKKNQGNLSLDIYVIEMGSTEQSKYASFKYDDPDYRGKAYGHNVAIRYAKARGNYRYYFTIMNDIYFTGPDNALQRLVEVADKNTEIGILSPSEPKSNYAGGICKPIEGLEFHCVSQCDYLALLVRGQLLNTVGYLTPEFKYCWGAIHELSYKMYSAGYKVAYCDVVQMYHMGGTTYGKVKNTISREEYKTNARKFAARYMVEHYGKKWDTLFSLALTEDVRFNTYEKHRKKWELTLDQAERNLYNNVESSDSLSDRINALNPWYYPVKIGGIEVTPGLGSRQSPKSLINRTAFRHKILVDEIVRRYDFRDKVLLDVASNCAYWSARYSEQGAVGMVAIEGRKEYVRQGQLYWSNNNFMLPENYKFVHSNVMDNDLWARMAPGSFDLTLCAGILYHVADYEVLLDHIARVTKEAIIVDTRVGEDELIQEKGGWCFDAIVETSMKKVPSLAGLIDKLKMLGFYSKQIVNNTPVPKEMYSNDNYNTGKRVCLFALRS